MAYMRNTWYVAAWDDEVTADKLFQRRLLDESIVFFRGSSGTVVALSNRCAHRFAPLHMGKLEGDQVQCPYHGLRYDSTGRCVHNPHGGPPPSAARLKAYPVEERYQVIWIWMGDPALADAALIPDFGIQDPDVSWVGRGYLRADANYMLEADNIMDLSHTEFLHEGTLGGEAVKHADTKIVQEGDTLWFNRMTKAEIMPDFLYKLFNIPLGTVVDRWFDVRWDAPANILLLAGATPTGQPRSDGVETPASHFFTPETETTTHYWFGICFPKALGEIGRELADRSIAEIRVPFETEDLPMLEAQQREMGSNAFWDLNPVMLRSDAGAVRARRILDRLIAAEEQALKQRA